MEPLARLTAPAVALRLPNIDTDQIIPARYLKTPRDQGYGGFLLHDLRSELTGFPLDRPEAAGAQILIAGRNFGCGSSREAAVYALVDAGFRCIVAPGFGDIFSANAVNNGLLPARVDDAAGERLLAIPPGASVQVDLEECSIECDLGRFEFSIDPVWRNKLLNGWDDIDLTQSYQRDINLFSVEHARRMPWSQLAPG